MQSTCTHIDSEKLFPVPHKAHKETPTIAPVSAPQIDITRLLRESPRLHLKHEIRTALSRERKEIPSVLLWDDKGLALFERLRESAPDAYYPSRKETGLLSRFATDVAATILDGTTLVELGSGYVSANAPISGILIACCARNIQKTCFILSAVRKQYKSLKYYALDCSSAELSRSLTHLERTFLLGSGIECHGLLGDYEDGLSWLSEYSQNCPGPTTVLWLGNSIGNFSSNEAVAFLTQCRQRYENPDLQFLLGVDGCRDMAEIERCYDPDRPETQEFLFNGLDRANYVLAKSCFNKRDWGCQGSFDRTDNTWKQFYVAKKDLVLNAAGTSVSVAKDERILAIRSAKWSQLEVETIAERAGFQMSRCWLNEDVSYGKTLYEV